MHRWFVKNYEGSEILDYLEADKYAGRKRGTPGSDVKNNVSFTGTAVARVSVILLQFPMFQFQHGVSKKARWKWHTQ